MIFSLALLLALVAPPDKHAPYKKAHQFIEQTIANLDDRGSYRFTRTHRTFAHLSRPWDTHTRDKVGTFGLLQKPEGIFIADTVLNNRKHPISREYYRGHVYAGMDYGDTVISESTVTDRDDFLIESAIYTPRLLLQALLKQEEKSFLGLRSGALDTIRYEYVGNRHITVVLDHVKRQVVSIAVLSADPMLGDVEHATTYVSYATTPSGQKYPDSVDERSHNTLLNELRISYDGRPLDTAAITSRIPATYALLPAKPEAKPTEIAVTKYNEQIYFLDVLQADSRTLLVNFKDFLLLAEAPLNTENAEAMIAKAHELFPTKPIRYFVHGHHHNWYLGGVRAFIHADVTLLAQAQDTSYIRELATFPHTLKPDILSKEPHHSARFETYDSVKIITDSVMEMQILKIGALSHHADDYAIYYFPQYKLLFEDDLMYFIKDSPIRPASSRQRGLYEGIQKYNLAVDTIIQNWPLSDMTVVPFTMLEQSVAMKK